jgi:hypothetical protein
MDARFYGLNAARQCLFKHRQTYFVKATALCVITYSYARIRRLLRLGRLAPMFKVNPIPPESCPASPYKKFDSKKLHEAAERALDHHEFDKRHFRHP